MNKKKYITILATVILSCCAANVFAAKANKNSMHNDTKNALHSAQYVVNNCSVKFYKALGGHTSRFGDRAEDYLENNAFWEDCIAPVLDKGDNAEIQFTVFTAKEKPEANDITQSVRTAISFVEEFTDYVGDVQEYTGTYEEPNHFTYLKVPAQAEAYNGLVREVRKTNRFFKAKHIMPKVHITVKMMKAEKPEDISAIIISGPAHDSGS